MHTLDSQKTLVTGSGDDIIIMTSPVGMGTPVTHVDAGDGVDRLDFSHVRQSVEIFLKDGGWGFAVGADGVVWHLRNAEDVTGTLADDHMVGDANDNTFEGSHGRDALDGKDGHDTATYAYSTQGIQ